MKLLKMRNTKLTWTLLACVTGILISFENCGQGFQVNQLSQSLDSPLTSNLPTSTNSNPPTSPRLTDPYSSALQLSILAGSDGGPGNIDGPRAVARFSKPDAIATDSLGNIFVADLNNNTIRRIDKSGTVTTIAGQAMVFGSADGTGATARFSNPRGIATDSFGNIFVADSGNHTIRKIDNSGTVTTIAGQAMVFGSADGTGSAARFNRPLGIATDSIGNIFVADTSNYTIRRIDKSGLITTIAGQAGVPGSTDGTGSAARFGHPNAITTGSLGNGIATDSLGNIFVADSDNYTVRKIDSSGAVITIVGESGKSGLVAGNLPGSLPKPIGVSIFGNTILLSSDYCILRATP